jgi:hypothetical protein
MISSLLKGDYIQDLHFYLMPAKFSPPGLGGRLKKAGGHGSRPLTAGAGRATIRFHQEETSQIENKSSPFPRWLRFMVAFSHVQRPFLARAL